jgi:hypothetical protein
VRQWLRRDAARNGSDPRALFDELAEAHGLSTVERRLAQRLARHFRLAHPGAVFCTPELFDPRRSDLPAIDRKQLEAVGRKLFAEPADGAYRITA